MVRENEKAFWFRTVKILDQMLIALRAVVATLVIKVCEQSGSRSNEK